MQECAVLHLSSIGAPVTGFPVKLGMTYELHLSFDTHTVRILLDHQNSAAYTNKGAQTYVYNPDYYSTGSSASGQVGYHLHSKITIRE